MAVEKHLNHKPGRSTIQSNAYLLNAGVVSRHRYVLHGSPDLLILVGDQHLIFGQ